MWTLSPAPLKGEGLGRGEALRTLLPADESKPWTRFAGLVESGDLRSRLRIDDVVYGERP
ncbi:MAG: hypothetical protein H6R26_3237 [Proteobacteria bacterium]|nr:hypothetical protein [Pseudomonadota bacterium]